MKGSLHEERDNRVNWHAFLVPFALSQPLRLVYDVACHLILVDWCGT